ncbi:P-loop ATPase, Sll1717 family [Thalassospira xiamenensis]|uniref:DNA repair ATPase n=1 Tax=Thalassospira xiamenensis TaxID=220697 RepID=A0A285TLP7_9PROT|nr:hypothetical protein [Thalassospira xiamenensis]SOC23511.1 hypothetical protein SAMN05428964_10483 [Thalassospira xiamenensis]
MSGNIILRKGLHIGEPGAEDDKFFLLKCFVDTDDYEEILDLNSGKSIVSGRTGSGKTALFIRLKDEQEFVSQINPQDAAFHHIDNSDIIDFLTEIGANFSVLFQYLWKDVILSEIVKTYFLSRNVFEQTLDSWKSASVSVDQFLKANSSKFWVDHDTRIEEITSGYEGQLRAEVGSEILSARASGELKLDHRTKKEVIARTKRIASDLRIGELNKAMVAIDHLMSNRKKIIYIVIDDLDSDWVNSSVKYQLIEALFESVKAFGKIKNVKILVSVRADILDRVLSESTSDGMQPEKYDGRSIRIEWSDDALFDLVEKRINHLFHLKYTRSKKIGFNDIFPKEVRKTDTFQFIVQRTLRRPRDIIAFINQILDNAHGKSSISAKDITDAESEYSRKRLDALKHEWKSAHPNLDLYINLLRRKTGTHNIVDLLDKESIVDLGIDLTDRLDDGCIIDSTHKRYINYEKRQSEKRMQDVCYSVAAVLYKTGCISIKPRKGDHFQSCYDNVPVMLAEEISEEATFKVEPMLWRALAITPNL